MLQLFGNLFGNNGEHGGDDVTVEGGPLADGPRFSDKILTQIGEFEHTDGLSEVGIGLISVTDVIDTHGWELTVPDTDHGVRFEMRTEEQIE